MANPDLTLASFRGGLNDTDPPHALSDDECTIAENVEFFFSTLGERRKGSEAVDITDSSINTQSVVSFITQWFPTSNVARPELFVTSVVPGTSVVLSRRDVTNVWSVISPIDAIGVDIPDIYGMNVQPLNGKLFFAYRSAKDRLHVWDGTLLRPTGLSEPVAAPTGANEGSGSYATVRYFRIRYVKRSGSVVLLRSEPSDTLTITPSGSGAGITITRPALIGEGETDWEVEASADGITFYHIATVAKATTTYNDETNIVTTDYADLGPLSEDIGTYELLSSYKYLSVDGDRLIVGGHWTDETKKSTIAWTPVKADPGAGNDERLPLEFDNTEDLDTSDGGEITGISPSVNGTWYVFKWNRIYKMTRTGSVVRAYTSLKLSSTIGAIPGSIISAIDEGGRACIYFLDPFIGPCRLGTFGIQQINGLRSTWKRVNTTAYIPAKVAYYPDKQQIRWIVSADGNVTPSLGLTLQITEMKTTTTGAQGGWSHVTGHLPTAYTIAVINEPILNESGDLVLSRRPYYGMVTPDFLQRGDTTDQDAGQDYVARIRSKPFFSAGLLNKWGVMTCALLASANATSSVKISLIRDFDRESDDVNTLTTDLAPLSTESYVVRVFNDLNLSEARAIQVEFSDP